MLQNQNRMAEIERIFRLLEINSEDSRHRISSLERWGTENSKETKYRVYSSGDTKPMKEFINAELESNPQ